MVNIKTIKYFILFMACLFVFTDQNAMAIPAYDHICSSYTWADPNYSFGVSDRYYGKGARESAWTECWSGYDEALDANRVYIKAFTELYADVESDGTTAVYGNSMNAGVIFLHRWEWDGISYPGGAYASYDINDYGPPPVSGYSSGWPHPSGGYIEAGGLVQVDGTDDFAFVSSTARNTMLHVAGDSEYELGQTLSGYCIMSDVPEHASATTSYGYGIDYVFDQHTDWYWAEQNRYYVNYGGDLDYHVKICNGIYFPPGTYVCEFGFGVENYQKVLTIARKTYHSNRFISAYYQGRLKTTVNAVWTFSELP